MSDDATLLQLYVRQRSEAAFAQLVRRHVDLVYGIALRQLQGDSHRAQEVTQNVFTDLAGKAASLSRRTTIAGWLFVCARYTAIDVIRHEQRRRVREAEAAMNDSLENSAPDLDWAQLRPVLDEVLGQLRAGDREAVLLRCVEQNTFAEVGRALRLNEDAARKRVERALGKLQVLLQRRGITSTAAALAASFATEAAVAAPAPFATALPGIALAQAAAGGGVAWPVAWKFMMILKTHGTALAIFAAGALVLVAGKLLGEHRDPVPPPAVTAGQEPDVVTKENSSSSGAAAGVVSSTAPGPTASDPFGLDRGGAWTVTEVRRMMENPEFRKALAARARARLDGIYGPLFQELNLPSSTLDRFKDLLVEKQQAKSDAANAARATGIARKKSPDTFSAAIAVNENETDQQMRELLGAASFARYEGYQRSFPARITVNLFRDELSPGDALTPLQLEQLVQAIVSTHPPRAGSELDISLQVGAGLFPMPGGVFGFTPDAVTEAENFLSPNQMAALDAFLERRYQRRQLRQSP